MGRCKESFSNSIKCIVVILLYDLNFQKSFNDFQKISYSINSMSFLPLKSYSLKYYTTRKWRMRTVLSSTRKENTFRDKETKDQSKKEKIRNAK